MGGAAAITLMLPFHELNAEILARTSPTVLDLITAGFCALAGVYASLRPGSDTAATAAGTSISISLVPPLCASGYGVGTLDGSVARGAALLFLTNLVAIVVIGTMSFVAAGFNRVDVVTLERDELQAEGRIAPIASALAQRLSRVFESRGGPALRFLMPFLLLGAVYIPLGRALDEVAWQVRVRSAVRASLADDTLRVVQSRVRVERQEVEIVVVLLGSAEDAEAARARLDTDIRRASGVVPRIEVLAVPDATAFAGLESTLLTPQRVAAALPTAPPLSPAEQLTAAQARVRAMVNELWPAAASGPALAVEFGTAEQGPLSVRVVHLGAPLGPDGVDTLRRALGRGLGREVRMVDVAVPTEQHTRANGDLRLVALVARGAAALATVPGSSVCVTRPGADAGSQKSRPQPNWRSRSPSMKRTRGSRRKPAAPGAFASCRTSALPLRHLRRRTRAPRTSAARQRSSARGLLPRAASRCGRAVAASGDVRLRGHLLFGRFDHALDARAEGAGVALRLLEQARAELAPGLGCEQEACADPHRNASSGDDGEEERAGSGRHGPVLLDEAEGGGGGGESVFDASGHDAGSSAPSAPSALRLVLGTFRPQATQNE